MKTIVISAVNIRKGGTLTILKDCLSYLSTLKKSDYRIVAIVHNKNLCFFPSIEYIDIPWSIKGWHKRLWCEYFYLNKLSQNIPNIDLWFSLHDTTPRVKAKNQALYCQTSFPFYNPSFRDFLFDPKIPLFAIFTKYIYKLNVHRNNKIIVQTNWLRKGLSKMLNVKKDKFIVAPPVLPKISGYKQEKNNNKFLFLYPATADVHKNFSVLLKASKLLEITLGKNVFEIILTINGKENKYSQSLLKNYSNVESIKFMGMIKQKDLFDLYAKVDALVFPSLIETWGLPISEFSSYDKPMLLSDLMYSHETSSLSKAKLVGFFDPMNEKELFQKMLNLINNDHRDLTTAPNIAIEEPVAYNWQEIFSKLI